MAKLVYDDTGRLLFTKEMKEEYTILMPQMLPVHFGDVSSVCWRSRATRWICSPPTTGASSMKGSNMSTTTPATPPCWSSDS
ncbi:MAG: hypothetical protein ACLRWQ_19580 [Flavonifractor plautii]